MASLQALLFTGYAYLILAVLAAIRLGIIIVFLPVFTRLGLSTQRRIPIAIMLSVPIFGHLLPSVGSPVLVDFGRLALLIGKESFLGLLLAVAFGVPFWAAAAAGDILDFQRGSLMAYLIDPSQITQASISGTFLELIMVALFYVGGGPHMLLTALYDSYSLWPPFAVLPSFAPESATLLLSMLDRVLALAFLLGGPLFIVLFMVEATMALVARMSPQLQVFYLSLPVKAIALFAVLPIYVPFYVLHAKEALDDGPGVLAALRGFFQ